MGAKSIQPARIQVLPKRRLDNVNSYKSLLTKLPTDVPRVLYYNEGEGPTWFFPEDMLFIKVGKLRYEFYHKNFVYIYNPKTKKVKVQKNVV